MKTLLYGIVLLGIMNASRAEVTLSVKPESVSLFVYEPFTVLVEANTEAQLLELPTGGGFTTVGVLPSLSDSSPKRFRIQLIPEQTGVLTIPPIQLQTQDGPVQTAPLRLNVAAPRPAHEMSLSISLSTNDLVVGQPVHMTVTWSSQIPFTQCNKLLLELPILRNPDWDVYPITPNIPENERIGLPVNGMRVIAQKSSADTNAAMSFSFVLIPRREGFFPAAPASLSCAVMTSRRVSSKYPSYFDNSLFNPPEKSDRFELIYLSTPLPALTVLALPETGRTIRYCGIVGPCTVSASIQPEQTQVGQPMLLTLALNDLTFGEQLNELPSNLLEAIGPEFKINTRSIKETTTEHSRTFTYIVRPLRSEISVLPAIALQIFDPGNKAYRTLRTEPIPLCVSPNENPTMDSRVSDDPVKALTPRTGIRANRKESKLSMNTYSIAELIVRYTWACWLIPPLLWIALRPWLRRRDRLRTDPIYARAARAAHTFNRSVRKNPESAWKTYLADRLNLNAETITRETILRELQKRNLRTDLLDEIQTHFVQQETALYAPQGTPQHTHPSIRDLVRKIEKAIPLILLMIVLLPAWSGEASTPPEETFQQAMHMRSTLPDQAQPLFTAAALEFEKQMQFINAGNSWFFAGENGRALANFLSAERRNPFNRQTRESIAFIRNQRADPFQTPENPISIISRTWKQLERWSPVLHGAFVTLLYLLGWILFLTARILGRTIPRRGWILISMTFLLPAILFLTALFQPATGVILESTEARLGPGYAYDTAYDLPLHESTEFQILAAHEDWLRIRLPDRSEAWIPLFCSVQIN